MQHSRQVRRQIARNGGLRTPGFTPVSSPRLHNWVQRQLLKLLIEMKGKSEKELVMLGLPTDPRSAQEEATRRALRKLPAPRMVRSTVIRPSKSDDPDYRRHTPKALRRAS